MDLHHPKIKHLPRHIVPVVPRTEARFWKRGEHHSHLISSIIINECSDQVTKRICKTIKVQNLKKFGYYDPRERRNIRSTEKHFISLTSLLRKLNFRQLKSLKLILVKDQNPGSLSQIMKAIGHLSQLEALEYRINDMSENLLIALRHTLKRLNHLKDYRLNINCLKDVTEDDFNLLLDSFDQLNFTQIRTLHIELQESRPCLNEHLVHKFLINLGLCLKNFSNLQRFRWGFDDLHRIENLIAVKALQPVFEIKSLEYVNISGVPPYDWSRHSEKQVNSNLAPLVNGLITLKNIRSLNLALPSIPKKQVIALAEGISQLSNLQEIRLKFLYSTLMRNLRRYDSCSYRDHIDDNAFKALCTSLMSHSSSLQVLDLTISKDITEYDENRGRIDYPFLVSSKGFPIAIVLLKCCTQLRQLHLFCPIELDQQLLIDITESVSKMIHLENLFLNLIGTGDVSNDWFTSFTRNIANLKLKELYLFLTDFNKVTDEGILELSNCLTKMDTLQILNVDFKGFSNITERARQSLTDTMNTIKSLIEARLCITLELKPRSIWDRLLNREHRLPDDNGLIKDIVINDTLQAPYDCYFEILMDKLNI